MTISSRFYTGYVDNIDWAEATRRLGFRYVVGGFDDFRVETDPTGTRRVKILANGAIATGGGIEDTADADELLVLDDAPVDSSRWHLVGLRRVWGATNATEVDSILGTSTKQIPTRPETPGTEDFQPLALVQITYGETLPTAVVDLRAVADNAGILIAFDDLVRSYMDAPGTVLRIGDTTQWVSTYTSGGAQTWIKQNLPGMPVGADDYDTGWVDLEPLTGWVEVGSNPPQVRRIGYEVTFRGRVATASGSNVSGSHTPFFVPGTSSLKMRPSVVMDGLGVAGGLLFRLYVNPDGSINTFTMPSVNQFYLTGLRYTLD